MPQAILCLSDILRQFAEAFRFRPSHHHGKYLITVLLVPIVRDQQRAHHTCHGGAMGAAGTRTWAERGRADRPVVAPGTWCGTQQQERSVQRPVNLREDSEKSPATSQTLERNGWPFSRRWSTISSARLTIESEVLRCVTADIIKDLVRQGHARSESCVDRFFYPAI